MSRNQRHWESASHATPSLHVPQASNENHSDGPGKAWRTIGPGEAMPLMFQIEWAMGRRMSFAYSDLRVVDCPAPSELVLSLYSLEKLRIHITGINLTDLATLLSLGRIRSLRESTSQERFRIDPEEPLIEAIAVESLTGSPHG